MPGLFVSYRRIDASAWAGRLFDHLLRRLGKAQVFMDVDGIPRGADFPEVLRGALTGCDALLAVIGPEWLTCARTDGRPRLSHPDDWVRVEIRTALDRGIPVCPVLVGGARMPEASELPEDLERLATRQAAQLDDGRWAYDVAELVRDLAGRAGLALVDDVAEASTGLRLLRDLVARAPAVADAVGRSREVLARTARQIAALDVHKAAHDALHVIEWECLRPLEVAGTATPLRRYRVPFADAERRIRAAIREGGVRPELAADLADALDAASRSFDAALGGVDPGARQRLVEDLRALLRGLPSRLDGAISEAARGLELQRVVELMEAVARTLPPAGADAGPELAPLLAGIDGLRRLRDELEARVEEHAALQDLDWKLRALCEAGTARAALPRAWEGIRRAHGRLPRPARTADLAAAAGDLEASLAEVTGALERADGEAAAGLLEPCSSVVSSTFRSVDTGLREFCLRLAAVNQPLRMVLEMTGAPAA